MCTKGPSLPKLIPLLSMKIMPSTFATKVFLLSMFGKFTPAIIALICGIPLPAACLLMYKTLAWAIQAKATLKVTQSSQESRNVIFIL